MLSWWIVNRSAGSNARATGSIVSRPRSCLVDSIRSLGCPQQDKENSCKPSSRCYSWVGEYLAIEQSMNAFPKTKNSCIKSHFHSCEMPVFLIHLHTLQFPQTSCFSSHTHTSTSITATTQASSSTPAHLAPSTLVKSYNHFQWQNDGS